MDQFRALETFVSVAEEESFAGAARVTGMSPPSVTRIIGELEQSLGATLFNRTTRQVTLTEVGQTYLADARRLLSDFQIANDAASGAYREPTGLLRVTASTLFGQHYISPIVLEYLDQYPAVSVDAVLLDNVVDLIDGGFDVAVRIGHLKDSSMMATRVGQVRFAHCGSPEYFEKHGTPQKPDDLKDHNIVTLGPLASHLEWRFKGAKPVRLKPRLIYSTTSGSVNATIAGWGITRALSYQIGPSLAEGKLITVLDEFQLDPMPIHIVHTSGRRPPAKVRAFIDLAVERLRENPLLS